MKTKLKIERFLKQDLWTLVLLLASFALFAWTFDKWIESTAFVVSHILIRPQFRKQYHSSSGWRCIAITEIVLFAGIALTLLLYWSLLSTLPVVMFMCWVGYIFQDRKDLQKEVALLRKPKKESGRTFRSRRTFMRELLGEVTEENIMIRCEEKRIDPWWRKALISLYIDKEKLKIVARGSGYTLEYFNTLLDEQLEKLT